MSQKFDDLSSSDTDDELPDLFCGVDAKKKNAGHSSGGSDSEHIVDLTLEDEVPKLPSKCAKNSSFVHNISDSDSDSNLAPPPNVIAVNANNLIEEDLPMIIEEIKSPTQSSFTNRFKNTNSSLKNNSDTVNFLSSKDKSNGFHCSDDELPEIQNFTVIDDNQQFDSAETETYSLSSQDTVSSAGSKRSKGSDKEEKERRKKQRIEEREQKAAEKARLKAEKERQKNVARSVKPGECLKYMTVSVDRRLLEMTIGCQVSSSLQESEIKYKVVDTSVPHLIAFWRTDALTSNESKEDESVIVVPIDNFISLVWAQIFGSTFEESFTLCQQCRQWKRQLGTNNLTIVAAGIEDYFRNQSKASRKNYRNAVSGSQTTKRRKNQNEDSRIVSRVDVETALAMLQIDEEVNHRVLNDPSKFANLIVQMTKSIAEKPFKLSKSNNENDFSWYAEGSNVNTVKIDKNGVGLLKLWHQQLRQFNNVGIETAQAIVSHYKSPLALYQAYKKVDAKTGSLLLADIPVRRGAGPLVSTRKVGPELSRRIHLFFTSNDPKQSL